MTEGARTGEPGTEATLGTFSYAPTDSGEQIVSSVTVSVSRPSMFSSLTLSVTLDGTQFGSATVDAPEISDDNVFTFDPPITIPAGGAAKLVFSITGDLVSRKSASIARPLRMAGILGGGGSSQSSSQEVVSISVTESGVQVPVSGLPIDLGKLARK